MRSDAAFAELIGSLECGPSFEFEADGHTCIVRFDCVCFGDGRTIRAQRQYTPDRPDDEVVADVFGLVAGLLLHEAQEHYTVVGRSWRNPHEEGPAFEPLEHAERTSVVPAPVAVSAPTEPPPDVPASRRLDTGWQPNSMPTVAYWPTTDPRRHRPTPMTAAQAAALSEQREANARQHAELLAHLESMRDL